MFQEQVDIVCSTVQSAVGVRKVVSHDLEVPGAGVPEHPGPAHHLAEVDSATALRRSGEVFPFYIFYG